jgi:2-octaprenyl-6-methoxyphenol hydroxylase
MSGKQAIVVGGGAAGLSCAALLAQDGVATTLVAPQANPDQRTTALMQSSLRLLNYIGCWPASLQNSCAALQQLHLIDDTGNMVSSPDIAFHARELGLDAFGWNVPLRELLPVLSRRCDELGVTRFESPCVGGTCSSDAVSLRLENGETLSSAFVVAADGAHSVVRALAGIETTFWKHDQSAIICQFSHSVPHQGISTEWHKSAGPFTTVPLPTTESEHRSSSVWMDRPPAIAALAALDDDAFAIQLQLQSHGRLGRIYNCQHRTVIPMQGLRATKLAFNRVVLIGEAAHQQPPIGAQGLNLTLRDVGHVADHVLAHDDPGLPSALHDFHVNRMGDVVPRQLAVSFLNGSLLGEFAQNAALDLGQLLRVGGLFAVSVIPPLRKAIMQQGMGEQKHLPFAMRG